ncbi:RNA polymerase sigma factor [Pedobacter deserti]|uniref:RNA polymerase sigma factor n=1 Tax=Pedobacter deserti TaxID=2817382 RepID=UPI00210A9EA5|nr:RNA polymerase sigma-70 factor [Pedobacter sp. SYSU D00382]
MKDKANISDFELLSRLKAGDELAFNVIYERYWQLLYVAASKVLRSGDDAKDVVQEIFMSFLAKGPSIEITGSLSNYLYTAVRYKVFDAMSRQKVRDNYADSFNNYVEAGNISTDNALIEKEIRAEMDREIDNLPEKMREVFLLSRKGEMSHKEIAETLNISDKTVKKQISNAVKLLRPKFQNYYMLVLAFFTAYFR